MMAPAVRSNVTVAVVTAVLTATLLTGIQGVLAQGEESQAPAQEAAVALQGFYRVVNAQACPAGGSNCTVAAHKKVASCNPGDVAVGGANVLQNIADGSLSSGNNADMPVGNPPTEWFVSRTVISQGFRHVAYVVCADLTP